jgi:hypothetical protein
VLRFAGLGWAVCAVSVCVCVPVEMSVRHAPSIRKRSTDDVPSIRKLSTDDVALMMWLGWSAEVNLSKYGGGVPLYLVYRKDMPVLSVTLSSNGERGFEFIDQNLRPRTGSACVCVPCSKRALPVVDCMCPPPPLPRRFCIDWASFAWWWLGNTAWVSPLHLLYTDSGARSGSAAPVTGLKLLPATANNPAQELELAAAQAVSPRLTLCDCGNEWP